jgi:putative ABC transport system ATP-binding protein
VREPPPAVEVKGVSKIYRIGEIPVHALHRVELTVERGGYVAVMGPSGSGKSTLLNVLGGVDAPTEGEIRVDGVRTDGRGERFLIELRRSRIAYIFQEARLLSSLSAIENVLLPLVFSGRAGRGRAEAEKALDKVGLAKRAEHLPHQLSGGEAQRVCIARALVTSPSVLLADEPTGNLDSRTGEEIMDVFDRLNAEGITILMVTHDPQKAAHARRTIRLRDGEIVEDSQATPACA